jgi:hypothetical protein
MELDRPVVCIYLSVLCAIRSVLITIPTVRETRIVFWGLHVALVLYNSTVASTVLDTNMIIKSIVRIAHQRNRKQKLHDSMLNSKKKVKLKYSMIHRHVFFFLLFFSTSERVKRLPYGQRHYGRTSFLTSELRYCLFFPSICSRCSGGSKPALSRLTAPHF